MNHTYLTIMKYFLTVFMLISLITNGKAQDCSRYNISTDPFTKVSSSSAGEIRINNEFSLNLKKQSNTYKIELNKQRDFYRAIVSDANISLPTIYNNTRVLFLLDNDEVIEITYTGRTMTANDPRKSDRESTQMAIRLTRINSRAPSSQMASRNHTPWYVTATANISLTSPMVNKLKNNNITMIRVQHGESKTDSNVSNQSYFKNFIECVD